MGKLFSHFAQVQPDSFPLLWQEFVLRLWDERVGGRASKECSVITALFSAQWLSLKMHAARKEHSMMERLR